MATFLHQLPSAHENGKRVSNLSAKPLYPYLSGSALLVNFITPNNQLPSVKLVFISLDYVSSS